MPTIELKSEEEPKIRIEVESNYEQLIPAGFRNNPIGYFEKEGKNVKTGEIKYDETGRVREDPTAVKELPAWFDSESNELYTVARRVNIEKGEIGKSGDPFYEYQVLKLLQELKLPAAKPVAKAEQGNEYLIVMEKITGVRWSGKDALRFRESGYSEEDIEDLKRQAEEQMAALQSRFEEAGIIREWKLKDMVFDVDVQWKKVRKVTPTDWERTRINHQKVEEYRRKLQKPSA